MRSRKGSTSFKGGPQDGAVTLDCGFYYGSDGSVTAQGGVDGSGYGITKTSDPSSVTITLTAAQPAPPAGGQGGSDGG